MEKPSRRDFLKITGAKAVETAVVAAGIAGIADGAEAQMAEMNVYDGKSFNKETLEMFFPLEWSETGDAIILSVPIDKDKQTVKFPKMGMKEITIRKGIGGTTVRAHYGDGKVLRLFIAVSRQRGYTGFNEPTVEEKK